MTDRQPNEPLDPELQREDARAMDNEAVGTGRDRAAADRRESGRESVRPAAPPHPNVIDEERERSAPTGDRIPRQDAEFGEEIDFPERDTVPGRESEKTGPVPLLAAGMFFPVVILAVVAIALILWFLL